MNSKIKNIIILVVVAIVLVLVYIFFIKKSPEEPLTSSSGDAVVLDTDINSETSQVSQDFISVLLNIKNIKINDAIFSDEAFVSLKDSTIILIPAGDEGRPNPFAPIGSETIVMPTDPTVGGDIPPVL